MRIYFLRHFESEKNVNQTLSTDADADPLTVKGASACVSFARELRRQLLADGHTLQTVLASSSSRGVESARIIANELGVSDVRVCQCLRSTNAGPYAGLSLEHLKEVNRSWYNAFQLFQAGLFNQYLFDQAPLIVEGVEPKSVFERRVVDGLFKELSAASGDAVVVVANRSSLNAILLHYARTYYGYPKEFYGYVPIEIGNAAIVEKTKDGGWQFLAVNTPSPILDHTS